MVYTGPVVKRTSSSSGACWLNRAERIARGLSGYARAKQEIHDGFIVEGKKVGAHRIASVIDIPGKLAMMGANAVTGRIVDRVPCGLRDPFSPYTPLSEPKLGEPESGDSQALLWGDPVAPGALSIAYGSAQGCRNAVYRADVLATENDSWLRVNAEAVGIPDRQRSVVVHEGVLKQLAPGLEHVARNQIGPARLQEPLPLASERGLDVFIATNMFKLESTPTTGGIYHTAQASLLLLRVNLDAMTLQGQLVPWAAFPAVFRPGTITTTSGETVTTAPARSRLLPHTSCFDAAGQFVVAFEYAVEVQDENGGSWVSMAGRAVWLADGGVSVDVYDVDVHAPRESALVAALGVPVDTIRSGVFPALLPDGSVLNTAAIFVRKSISDDPGTYTPTFPYSVDTVNGVQVADMSAGFGALFGTLPDNPAVLHIIGVGTSSAFVSRTTVACRRADPSTDVRPPRVGVLFTDGVRFKYEPLGSSSTPSLHISCLQQEVRGEDGELRCPAVILASFEREGIQYIGIRKGPIWDEDGWEPEAEYWVTVPAPESEILQAPFYLSNRINTRRHGAYFMEQPDD